MNSKFCADVTHVQNRAMNCQKFSLQNRLNETAIWDSEVLKSCKWPVIMPLRARFHTPRTPVWTLAITFKASKDHYNILWACFDRHICCHCKIYVQLFTTVQQQSNHSSKKTDLTVFGGQRLLANTNPKSFTIMSDLIFWSRESFLLTNQLLKVMIHSAIIQLWAWLKVM